MSKLPEIPSEFIEPYLAKFMGSMIEFFSSAHLTEEDKIKNHNTGWTVEEIKTWIKGVDVFISQTCGIHARIAISNEMDKMINMPDAELKEMCRNIIMGTFEEQD